MAVTTHTDPILRGIPGQVRMDTILATNTSIPNASHIETRGVTQESRKPWIGGPCIDEFGDVPTRSLN